MPNVVSGAINLLNAASGWLLALVPLAGGVMVGYHAIMKAMSDGDYQAVEQHNRGMRNVIVAAAIGEAAMGLVKFIIPYFK